MLRFLLKRPKGVSVSILAVLLVSVLAMKNIPTRLMPETSVNQLQINVSVPNASPIYVERAVLSPIRVSMQGLLGIENIESIAGLNTGQISLVFEYETDMQLAYLQAQEKLDQLINSLPEIPRPVVRRVLQTDIPIARLQLSSESLSLLQLSSLAENIVKRRLEQIDGVGLVAINGSLDPLLRVNLDEQMMTERGVTPTEVMQLIKTANFKLDQLKVVEGNYEYELTFDPMIADPDDIEQLLYSDKNGNTFPLGQLLKVHHGWYTPQGLHLTDGKRGIVFAIHQQGGADQRQVTKSLEVVKSQLSQELPTVTFSFTQQQSVLLHRSISQLIITLLLACLLAGSILWVFNSGWKTPLMMFLLIPIAMFTSVGLMYALGYTINIISLSGMILGIGILVDNGIILLDNIRRHSQEMSLLEACIKGTTEVLPALFSSTLTTLSVFLPLSFLPATAGVLFREQIISLSIILFTSLIAAFFVLPLIFFLLGGVDARAGRLFSWVLRKYKSSQRRFKSSYVLIVTLAFLFSGVYVGLFSLTRQGLPEVRTDDAAIHISWSEAVAIGKQELWVRQALEGLSSVRTWEVDLGKNLIYEPGINDRSQALIYAAFDSETQKEMALPIIIDRIQKLDQGARVEVRRAKNPYDQLFVVDKAQVEVRIRSNDDLNGRMPADEWDRWSNSWDIGLGCLEQEGWLVRLNEDRILHMGISRQQVLDRIKLTYSDQYVTTLNQVNTSLPIVMTYAQDTVEQRLDQAMILVRDSIVYPLQPFFELTPVETPRYVTADQSGPYYSLSSKMPLEELSAELSEHERRLQDEGFWLNVEGAYIEAAADRRFVVFAFALAVLLLFVILSAQFESVKIPVVILSEIPISLAGSVIALWLTGQSINISSLMGMIIMLGIIINDSILKVDTIQRNISIGMSVSNAVQQAGQVRLQAILMTSLTTILALVPIFFGSGMGVDLQVPLAISVIGGLLVGTFCSIYLLPIVYLAISPEPRSV
jgi:multidrug efflux pump subunit AcrB